MKNALIITALYNGSRKTYYLGKISDTNKLSCYLTLFIDVFSKDIFLHAQTSNIELSNGPRELSNQKNYYRINYVK
jgi:hypothetical protein